MFENIKKTLSELEDAIHFLENGNCDEDKKSDVTAFVNAENIINYFELHLAESMMKDRYIDVKKLAEIILAVNGNSKGV